MGENCASVLGEGQIGLRLLVDVCIDFTVLNRPIKRSRSRR